MYNTYHVVYVFIFSRMVLKLTFDPDSLRSEVTSLRDSLLSAMDRGDASSLQGFITSYAFLCDFFGVSFSSEVVWVCFVICSCVLFLFNGLETYL